MHTELTQALEQSIQHATGEAFKILRSSSCSGGCIHTARVLHGTRTQYFLKSNTAQRLPQFEAEFNSLQAIATSQCIRTPKPISYGSTDTTAFLVLEYLELHPSQNPQWHTLGTQLAQLHQQHGQDFGWQTDNFIGDTPQSNRWQQNWADFFVQERLEPLFRRAADKGLAITNGNHLLEHAHAQLATHHPKPALLHGDLWSGNAAFLTDGTPVIFDPASYYGDPETDLAMTELFGGFPASFYHGYASTSPLSEDRSKRTALYNLYHILNHAILFGGNYVIETQQQIGKILTES